MTLLTLGQPYKTSKLVNCDLKSAQLSSHSMSFAGIQKEEQNKDVKQLPSFHP